MKKIGRLVVTKGLAKSFRIPIRADGVIPSGFASMEFRGGVQKPDGKFTTLAITTTELEGVITVTISETISDTLTAIIPSVVVLLYKHTTAGQAFELGYFDVLVADRGFAWS